MQLKKRFIVNTYLVWYLLVLTSTRTLMSGEAAALNAHILLPELVKSVFKSKKVKLGYIIVRSKA